MLTLYSVEDAQKTILRRDNALFFADAPMTEAQKAAATKIYGKPLSPDEGVRHILRDIHQNGDSAVKAWTAKLDRVELAQFEISAETITAALTRIDPDLRQALETASAPLVWTLRRTVRVGARIWSGTGPTGRRSQARLILSRP